MCSCILVFVISRCINSNYDEKTLILCALRSKLKQTYSTRLAILLKEVMDDILPCLHDIMCATKESVTRNCFRHDHDLQVCSVQYEVGIWSTSETVKDMEVATPLNCQTYYLGLYVNMILLSHCNYLQMFVVWCWHYGFDWYLFWVWPISFYVTWFAPITFFQGRK